MKLAEWARVNGVRKDTAYRWFHAGILPAPAMQLPTGTIFVTGPAGGCSSSTAPGWPTIWSAT